VNTLARRLVWFALLVAAVSVLISGLAAYELFRNAANDQASASLSRDLDFAGALLSGNATPADQADATRRMRLLMSQRGITMTVIKRGAAAPAPLTAADLTAARSTGRLGVVRSIGGEDVMVQGKLTEGGTVVVLRQPVQRALSDVPGPSLRLLLPLGLGLIGGGVAGLALAQGISRPLRQVSHAARRLIGGERGVQVPVEGPMEVADVAQALNNLSGALDESEQGRRRFLGAVAHEIRPPLVAMAAYGESLATGTLRGPEAAEAGGMIRNEALRLQKRLEEMAALAAVESTDFTLDVADADAGALVRGAAKAWRPRAEAAGVRLSVEAPREPLPLRTDPDRVRQAVDTLVDNALRALPAEAPLVISARAEANGWVRLEVRDGGPSRDRRELAGAFDRARSTEHERGDQGNGDGSALALVGELARKLGGHAEARPAPEGGAGFALLLPPR
jgi:two-component system sensor histidine kinase BaeS